ncbi:SDR family oxidoreductase [Aquibacillus albus]|uniref:NADP-dependent 3-hydroxy acid dehydrogenase YdfG n=1 Tax=Aquibacillus albus TaxID=1168171 RepID=A0ABS2MYA2_9BACI|nr:SDR family oxidoreductase [Aquibacillus albus]MBM7570850.1 NADP-dependent 3-hydroxy acid dehydrogenase YdfG [Aquibacillus albus]
MTEQKVVVITGASRGIGRNAALFFAENGYAVIATGRSKEKLEALERELQQNSSDSKAWVMDVTKPSEISQVIEQVRTAFGRIDVWINNAGAFMAIGPTWEVKVEDWLNDVKTNLFGTFHCVQSIVPIMLEQKFGRIINLVGGGTIDTFKYGNGYGTSKTAIARFTENLDAELEGSPVKAFALDPGLNDTDMTRYQRETEVGQTYLSGIENLFEQNIDVAPYQAPQWAFHLASGELDEFSGRVVSVYDDADELKKQLDDDNSSADLLKLRLKK